MLQMMEIAEQSCQLTRAKNYFCCPVIIALAKNMSKQELLKMEEMCTKLKAFNKRKVLEDQ